MKIVAVSQRVDSYPNRNEQRDALDQRLTCLILSVGFLPIPVPNNLLYDEIGGKKDIFKKWISTISPNAIILSGGNDVGSCNKRDMIEKSLLDYAEHNKLPVLGICRGMQMMAVRAGGKLHSASNHVKTRHRLVGHMTHEVNSYHKYILSSCPSEYNVLARSSAGEIEAIRHKQLPWEGWMWHPEREELFNSKDVARMDLVLNPC